MYQADHEGEMFEQIGSLPVGLYYQIGSSPMNECSSECLLPDSAQLEIECINLSELSELGYLPVIPVDTGNPDSSCGKDRIFPDEECERPAKCRGVPKLSRDQPER